MDPNPRMSDLPSAVITIRPAVREDDRAIRAMVRGEHLNPLGLDWRNFLVAEDPGRRIVGIGAVKRHGDGSRELASIAVTPEDRGRGTAGAIIRTILERESQGMDGKEPGVLYLTCRNTMKEFYGQFGFREIGTGEMPPYFRRLYKIFLIVTRVFRTQNKLVVMRKP
jgi:N-acetylglutamate synthase-like GNAT family acetyltransferase